MKYSVMMILIFLSNTISFAQDVETNSFTLQPYKKNFIIFGPNEGRNEDGDFKLQISFLTLFKAHEFDNDVLGLDVDSAKVINLGFNYTQTFFNAFGEESKPIESTDYMPGLFISYQSRKPATAGFRQFSIGWEHESNGEFEGQFNRSWDRGYGEILLGYGKDYSQSTQTYEQITAESNNKSRTTPSFVRMGNDQLNLRFRVAWPINISEDNQDIRNFYGVYELEASVRNKHHEAGVTLLAGHDEVSTVVEINSKRVPFLSDVNETVNNKFNCQGSTRSGVKQRLACLARYFVAPFDLADNHGAWMFQYFNGYGERVRDYNIKTNGAFRVGYRFSMR